MAKTGSRYPMPLARVFREAAGDWNIPPYELEVYMACRFMLDLAPTAMLEDEQSRIQHLCHKLEMTFTGLPDVILRKATVAD